MVILTFSKQSQLIAALEPCYGDSTGGNATKIYSMCSTVFEDSRKLNTILKNLVRSYSADLTTLRKNYGERLGYVHNVPLPLGMGMVLVPIKMRKPYTVKDGATGYVNLFAVEDLIEAESNPDGIKCYLLLKGGLKVPSLHSLKNTKRRLKNAHNAWYCYYYLHFLDKAETGDNLILQVDPLNQGKTFIDLKKGLYFKLITDDDDDEDDDLPEK